MQQNDIKQNQHKNTDTMEEDIKALILKYGLRQVHEGIEKEYRAMYDYLKTLYNDVPPQPEKKVIRKAKNTVPDPQEKQEIQEEIQEEEQKESPEESSDFQELQEEEIQSEIQEPPNPTDKEVTVITKKSTATPPYKEKTPEERREAIKQHRDAVQKKHEEFVAKGIQPESLLTKENLEKWLKAGKSYQQIARDYTGVHETQVSAIAKAFGLQSQVSKMASGFVRRSA
jgi:hypothetical protein